MVSPRAAVASLRDLQIALCKSTSKAMDPRFIDDLARRLSASVPAGLTAMRDDLHENFKAVLQSTLARLDLVTRQEFDVQAGVLRRTREKLEALEARLAVLEGKQ
jgi:BMFP domain-containing protein YqiC